MADLTYDAPLRYRFPEELRLERFLVDSSVAHTIYRGQPVIIDASVDTVNLCPFVAAFTKATGDIFVGIASEGIVVASGAAEAQQEIEVITSGEVGFKSAVFTDASIGASVYMQDSGVLNATQGTNGVKIGVLRRVVDGYAYVEVNAGAMSYVWS